MSRRSAHFLGRPVQLRDIVKASSAARLLTSDNRNTLNTLYGTINIKAHSIRRNDTRRRCGRAALTEYIHPVNARTSRHDPKLTAKSILSMIQSAYTVLARSPPELLSHAGVKCSPRQRARWPVDPESWHPFITSCAAASRPAPGQLLLGPVSA